MSVGGMSLRLGSASGTYNVRASELARDRPTSKMVKCVVRFLDDSEATFEIMVRIKHFMFSAHFVLH